MSGFFKSSENFARQNIKVGDRIDCGSGQIQMIQGQMIMAYIEIVLIGHYNAFVLNLNALEFNKP